MTTAAKAPRRPPITPPTQSPVLPPAFPTIDPSAPPNPPRKLDSTNSSRLIMRHTLRRSGHLLESARNSLPRLLSFPTTGRACADGALLSAGTDSRDDYARFHCLLPT